ncbi:glycine zipper domain-containing protein [Desulfovibrio inopinatus]|uniref:glycine zipper domain-containing protein n=1 Tax=Desulfovibrio inopinatus TaxID=102109 RepID=UPI000412BAEB|nr:glycine zipper domain-containing protein [Desulfovibrio inopinatus]
MKARHALCILALIGLIAFAGGCTRMNRAQQGAALGTAAGAAVGGLATNSWEGAAIGGAVGLGGGYIIGNEMDKANRYKYYRRPYNAPPPRRY